MSIKRNYDAFRYGSQSALKDRNSFKDFSLIQSFDNGLPYGDILEKKGQKSILKVNNIQYNSSLSDRNYSLQNSSDVANLRSVRSHYGLNKNQRLQTPQNESLGEPAMSVLGLEFNHQLRVIKKKN